MDITVLPESFLRAVKTINDAIERRNRDHLSILDNILLETDGDCLRLAATNLELTLRMAIGAKITKSGAITLPGKTLLEIAQEMPVQHYVHLTLDEATQTVKIVSREQEKRQRIDYDLKGMAAREFPTLPHAGEGFHFTLPGETLKQALDQTLYALADSDNRPALTGIYFEVSPGQVMLTGADGFRLAHREIAANGILDTFAFILPGRSAQRLTAAIDIEKPVTFSVDIHGLLVQIEVGDLTLISQVIGSKFPDYLGLLRPVCSTSITVYTNDLLRACKRAAIFTEARIHLSIAPALTPATPGQLRVFGRSAERGDAETYLDCEVQGEALNIQANVFMLMDVCNALAVERLRLEFDGAFSGIAIHPDDTAIRYDAMIMPMRDV